MIRVFLVDDHEVVRLGIAHFIDAQPDLEVVGEAGSYDAALRRIGATTPDLAVLDVRLPDGNGIDLCRKVRSAHPSVKCLILTGYDDHDALTSSILAGASGYVLKDVRGSTLLDAIRKAACGEPLQTPEVLRHASNVLIEKARALPPDPQLSMREGQVLTLIANGMTNREIGASLGLAEKTVKNYVSALLATLGLARRTQAAIFAADRK